MTPEQRDAAIGRVADELSRNAESIGAVLDGAAKSYRIEITAHDVDYHDEAGDWLDGDRRELAPPRTTVASYDADDTEEHGSPVAWAVERISKTDAYEPSQLPVPAELPEHAWLSGSYADPYTTRVTETSVRLPGDWTEGERAEVLRSVYRRVFPNVESHVKDDIHVTAVKVDDTPKSALRAFTMDERARMESDLGWQPDDFAHVDGVKQAAQLRAANGYGRNDCQWCGRAGGH